MTWNLVSSSRNTGARLGGHGWVISCQIWIRNTCFMVSKHQHSEQLRAFAVHCSCTRIRLRRAACSSGTSPSERGNLAPLRPPPSISHLLPKSSCQNKPFLQLPPLLTHPALLIISLCLRVVIITQEGCYTKCQEKLTGGGEGKWHSLTGDAHFSLCPMLLGCHVRVKSF